MKAKRQKYYVPLLLIGILVYAFFKLSLCRFYSVPVAFVMDSIGFSSADALDQLNAFSPSANYETHYLGWVIYYPTYLLLHLIFIAVLFADKPRVKKKVQLGLIIVVTVLIILLLATKLLDLDGIFAVFYAFFKKIFSLPFILLAIEGGRVFLLDIDRMLQKKK